VTKRATRFKAEVYDSNGNVVWEVLVHDWPSPNLAALFRLNGFAVRQPSKPPAQPRDPFPVYSLLDPANSIRAFEEFAARRVTKTVAMLEYLLKIPGVWVERNVIRQVAGDSGDRRVRELRQYGWPIEIQQQADGKPWAVRLNIPPDADGKLFR
jgi:hypothetical protein